MATVRALFAILLLGIAGLAEGQRTEATEASLKAAYLFKFAGYIEWSAADFESPAAPIAIGVVGAEDIAAELTRIVAGRNIAGHPVVVKRLSADDAARGLQMLFVGRDTPRAGAVARAAQSQGVLVVTDMERGLEMGGAINFVSLGERLGFEVSLESAERSGHRISSRMLSVARRVVPKAGA
ncbi:MAG TPA: YfiR family protein [Usitatibacter sp.]|jgi:hypothetical protein|nr:YfiR family protein [Usitatibacter sp.]